MAQIYKDTKLKNTSDVLHKLVIMNNLFVFTLHFSLGIHVITGNISKIFLYVFLELCPNIQFYLIV